MEGERPDIPLARLTHDVVQTAYKDLHALLDSLADYEPEDRQSRLLDAVLKIRHRFARISATVKWYMAYSAFHNSARIARNFCFDRGTVFTLNADTLWQVSAATKTAAANPSAIQEAAQVLSGYPTFNRLPRYIEDAIGLQSERDIRNISRILSSSTLPGNLSATPQNTNHTTLLNSTQIKTAQSNYNAEVAILKSKPSNTNSSHQKHAHSFTSIEKASATSHTECEYNSTEEIAREAIERLRVTTKHIISSSLPKGVQVIKVGVGPCAAALRIGVPDSWTADVILDQLKVEQAFVVLIRFQILVDSHPDALSVIRSRYQSCERPLPLRAEHREPLRQMLSDRMRWRHEEEKGSDGQQRITKVLFCLSQAMSFECCGKLAMTHVRAQTAAFHSSKIWNSSDIAFRGVGSSKENDSPIHIFYWLRSYMKATLMISLITTQDATSLPTSILRVDHDSKLPFNDSGVSLSVKSINVQTLLLESCRIRAIHELRKILQSSEAHEDKRILVGLNTTGRSSVSLMYRFDEQGVGLIFSIALKSGGFMVRTAGILTSALAQKYELADELEKEMWYGERFFSRNTDEIVRSLDILVSKSLAIIQSDNIVRSSRAGGNDVINTWPPGAPSVEKPEVAAGGRLVKPPLIGIERKRPRRFMTTSSTAKPGDEPYFFPGLPVAKRARSVPLAFSTSSDGSAFIQGRCVNSKNIPPWCNDLKSSSSVMANWSEMRSVIDLRLKRDHLLRELELKRIATPLDDDYRLQSPHRTPLKVKASPMEVGSAYMIAHGDGSWRIELTLANELFDDHNCNGHVVTFCRRTKMLTFKYPDLSPRTTFCFARDMCRARTAAALIGGLNADTKAYKVVRRAPTHVEVSSQGLIFVIGLGKRVVEITTSANKPLVSTQFIPFVEEILHESAMEMGARLGELLEASLPMFLSIENALPADPTAYKIRFSNALKARIIFRTSGQQSYAVDVDARHEKGKVVLFDVPRALQTIQKQDATVTNSCSSVPFWPHMVKKLVENCRGRTSYRGAAVQVPITVLRALLTFIAKNASGQ